MRGAVDFETSHWTSPLCAAVAWGAKGARETRFLHAKRKAERPGLPLRVLEVMAQAQLQHEVSEWWAHNGGKFDWLILVEAALSHRWKFSGGLSADGRALMLSLTPPKALGGKDNILVLKDSFAIVPSRLKHKRKKCEGCAACDWQLDTTGVFTGEDYSVDPSRWPHRRLKEGCLKDATLVLDLLDAVEAQLEPFGVQLDTTFSQAALGCVKHHLAESGYGGIPSHGGANIKHGRQVENELCRRGDYGGRVEIFRHWHRGKLTEIDRNSSYPAGLTEKLPWHPLGKAKNAAELSELYEGHQKDGTPIEGILHATVCVPDDCDIPVLPVKNVPRHGKPGSPLKGMFFPTGTFDGWWPAVELRYAVKVGAAEVLALHDGVRYSQAQPFASFIQKAYRLKASTTGAQKSFWKFLLNGAGGKFGQDPERENICAFADAGEAMHFMHKVDGRPLDTGPLPKVIAWKKTRWPKHTHYALAAYMKAHARIAVHQALLLAVEPCYTDTDSVHASIRSDFSSLLGAELGQWKVELAEFWAEYFAAKLYCQVNVKTGKVEVACKGFPVDEDSFRRLVMGEVLHIDRIRLLKSQLRGNGKFERLAGQDAATREWKGHSRKRKPLPNGTTVPWAYEELQMNAPAYAESPAYQRLSARVDGPLQKAAARVRRQKRQARHTR